MHVAITGASGFLGTSLTRFLREDGHTVTRFVRRRTSASDEARWDPEAGEVDTDTLGDLDAVVHLAGEGIAERRWSDEQKRRIMDSRVQGTTTITTALASMEVPPAVLISVSGINYYGDRGDEVLTEDSGPGTEGFLPQVTKAWEAAADPAREAGIRVVHPRIGIVLSPSGGALERMLPIYKLGVGGRLGSGRQYWPWISVEDVIGIFHHALVTDDLAGPVNAVSPNPVTNAEFTRTLAKVLRRPAVVPVPKLGPSVLLGRELTRELLFTSMRALPERLEDSGYAFRQPSLEPCLRDLLDKPERA